MTEMRAVQSFASVRKEELAGLRGVCLDIDDTLSTHGKLTAEAYGALWKLKSAGFYVVPITGRPAGWCDHIARFWAVDAVVGENGAFTLFMQGGPGVQGGILRRLETVVGETGEPASRVRRARLEQLGVAIRARFPHAKWASDQAYRDYDLAIDFCEDVPAWTSSDVAELVRLCEREGAHAKVSSIHVNAWFGDYDKLTGFKKWREQAGESHVPSFDEWIFIGDSPNDEPLFRAFGASVGVANLLPFLSGAGVGGRTMHAPKWITSAKSGAGFVEMAEKLIESRV